MASEPVPDTLRYTKDHEWTRGSSPAVTVGITQFAVDQLGDVVFVELPAVGATLAAGAQFGVVESTKAVSELFSPLSGKVVKVNAALTDAPDKVSSDPYGEGWMIELEPSEPKELDALLSAAQYKAILA